MTRTTHTWTRGPTLFLLAALALSSGPHAADANEPGRGLVLSDEPVADFLASESVAGEAWYGMEEAGPGGVRWLENGSLFLGIDGSKQPQDFGINANFGGRSAINWGIPLIQEWGLGAQVGTALNASANAVQVPELLGESSDRWQSFTTVGLFQRTDVGWQWGGAYDFLEQESFDRFRLGQWRLMGALELNPRYLVGIQVALPSYGDTGFFDSDRVRLDPIAQGSLFWRQTWESHVQTTFWGGIAEGHSEANAVTGDRPPLDEQFVFGADFYAPLGDRLALFGEANFIMPPDTGTVDAYLGVVFFPWGDAWHARQLRFSPLFSVANNTNLAVDLSR